MNIFNVTKTKWITTEDFISLPVTDVFSLDQKEYENTLPKEFQNYRILVKRTFDAPVFKKATIKITADDYYKLYINGRFVGQGPAQGYHFNYYWNEYDISDFLLQGENTVEVCLLYSGLLNRAYNSADNRMGMIAELYVDGNIVLSTDETWKYTVLNDFKSTNIIGYSTLFAEIYDSRVKPTDFKNCCILDADYTFGEKTCKPLQVYTAEPRITEKLADNIFFYDFGSVLTGTLKIEAKGKTGSFVRILTGEETDNSRLKTRYKMRCNCICEDGWILDDGECTFEQYDYRSFRYATIVADEDVEIVDVRVIVRHYPFDDEYCNLETDDETLKRVWELCKNTSKYGTQEVYVDCPTREKGQYAGDLTISSATHIVLTGDISLLEKAIDNQIQSMKICPGLLAVTPGSFSQEIADYSLQFPILALRHYEYTKDIDYLKKCLSACEDILNYFGKYQRDDGLLYNPTGKWNLVDWPAELRDNYEFSTDKNVEIGCHNVINAFYIGCMKQTEQIKDILGIAHGNKSERLKEAFNRAFFDREKGVYVDCVGSKHSAVHSNIIPLYYGINEKKEEGGIADYIIECKMRCGVYMSYFLLKALCNASRYEDAYNFIVSKDENSWYNMLREGATTTFEAWGKDRKWNTSLCHPWATGPVSVLAEDILPNMPEKGILRYKKK